MLTKAQFFGCLFIAVISFFAIKDVIKDKSSRGLEESVARIRTVISSSFSNIFPAKVETPLESWVKSEAVGADGKVGRLEVVLEKDSVLEHKENKNCHLDVVDSVLKVEGNQNVYLACVKNRLEVLKNQEGVIVGDGNSGKISKNQLFRMELNETKEVKIIGNYNTKIQSNGGTITAENNTHLIISGSDHNLEVRGARNLKIRKSLKGHNRIEVTSGSVWIVLMYLETQGNRGIYTDNRWISKDESWVDIDGFSKSRVEFGAIEVEYVNSASVNGNSFVIEEFAFTVTPVDHDTLDIVSVKFNHNITKSSYTHSYVYIGMEGSEKELLLEGPKIRISYENPREIRVIL